jgi:iron complex outermembrane receptor protein
VLSENLNTGATPSPDITPILAPLGVRGGRFFLNGVDTETEGVDVVLRQKFALGSAGNFDLGVFANYNNTDVTKVPQAVASLTSRPVLFGRINVNTFEDGTPDVKAGLIGDWTRQVGFGSIGANLKATYYGEVIEPTAPTTVNGVTMMDIDLGEHVLLDLSFRAKVGERMNFTVGVDNLTDEYPDKTAAGLNPQAALAYSRYSPFGFNGRFLYGRASFSW